MTKRSLDDIRRDWMGRLGQPVDLPFPFFAVDDAWPAGQGRTVVAGELGTGSIRVGDQLEAVGISAFRIPVRILGIDRPLERRGAVEAVQEAGAGDVLGLLVGHEPAMPIVRGQCLAPTGALRASARISGNVWIVTSDDLPGTQAEHQAVLEDMAASRGIDLFFHTTGTPARAVGAWRPRLGAEYSLTFQLEAPVALYPGARFAIRYDGLTVGVGFVED